MKVDLRKLSDIKPYPGNPRHNDQAVDAVAASIQAFGFRQPIVVHRSRPSLLGVGVTPSPPMKLMPLNWLPIAPAP